ncbi:MULTISPECIES: hypothetical protein [unclassified Streptomyces]
MTWNGDFVGTAPARTGCGHPGHHTADRARRPATAARYGGDLAALSLAE